MDAEEMRRAREDARNSAEAARAAAEEARRHLDTVRSIVEGLRRRAEKGRETAEHARRTAWGSFETDTRRALREEAMVAVEVQRSTAAMRGAGERAPPRRKQRRRAR
ncbi:MAG TPA: hypothetical protein VIR81_03135 [Myxococcales bacterium]